jgi:hypothetical protein
VTLPGERLEIPELAKCDRHRKNLSEPADLTIGLLWRDRP